MNDIRQNSQNALTEVLFNVLGADHIVKHISTAGDLVAAYDFEGNAERDAIVREKLMQRVKLRDPSKFELRDGSIFEGRRVGYRESAMIFFTRHGLQALPFSQIPAELQRAIQDAPEVRMQTMVETFLHTAQQEAEARSQALDETLSDMEERIANLQENIRALVVENGALKRRIAELEGDRE